MIDEIINHWDKILIACFGIIVTARGGVWLYRNTYAKISNFTKEDKAFKEAVTKNINHLLKTVRSNGSRVKAAMAFSEYAYWDSDIEGNCIFASEKLCKLINRTESQILGGNWLNNIVKEDRERVSHEWADSIKNKTTFISKYTFDCAEDGYQLVEGIAYHNEYGSTGKLSPIGGRTTDYVSKVEGGKIYNIQNIENANFKDNE